MRKLMPNNKTKKKKIPRLGFSSSDWCQDQELKRQDRPKPKKRMLTKWVDRSIDLHRSCGRLTSDAHHLDMGLV